MTSSAADVVAAASAVLMDFDGPICAVFGGLPAPEVAHRVRDAVGLDVDDDARDPLDILRTVAGDGPEKAAAAEHALTNLEIEAVQVAPPTPSAAEVLETLAATVPVVIVSNNSAAAVRAYLERQSLSHYVTGVVARTKPDPALLKPDPHLVDEALRLLNTSPSKSVFIGDSVSDIQAGHAAGVPVVAYANKPSKRERFESVGPAAIVDSMAQLVPRSPVEAFATPRMAAGAVFVRDDQVLLVRKKLGHDWDIPGGYVDVGESPAAACTREIQEELSLTKRPRRLLAVDWAPSDAEGDKVLWLFDCGDLNVADQQRIELDESELDQWAWVAVTELGAYAIPRLARRLTSTFNVLKSAGNPAYLEHGSILP